jgi:hypothetical protein
MIADGADHAMLQIIESDLVWEAINVQLGIVVAAWVRAVDEQAALSQASHIRERHRLVVKHQVRDRPGHARMIPPKRGGGEASTDCGALGLPDDLSAKGNTGAGWTSPLIGDAKSPSRPYASSRRFPESIFGQGLL